MMRLAYRKGPSCGHFPIPGSIACPTCPAPEDWREEAACASSDPEAFYPDPRVAIPVGVLDICARCPVQPYCLEDGWQEQHGIWGGWTEQARAAYRKEHRNLPRPVIRALGAQTRFI